MDTIMDLAGTAALAMLSVGLWTVRVALTARGSRVMGSSVAAAEATVFAAAFSRLLGDLDSPARIAAYGLGVAGGTLAGLWIDSRLRPLPAESANGSQYLAGGSLAGKDSRPISSTSWSFSGESEAPSDGASSTSGLSSARRLATSTSTNVSAITIPSAVRTRSDFIPVCYPPAQGNETSGPDPLPNRRTGGRTAHTPVVQVRLPDDRGAPRKQGTPGGANKRNRP
jgi:hypothetical protein